MPKVKPPFFQEIKVDFAEGPVVDVEEDAKNQAKKILDEARQNKLINEITTNEKTVIGLTYSANSNQAQKIHELYKKIDTKELNVDEAEEEIIKILADGANQAAVVREIMTLLKKEENQDLRGYFRILPITTMKPGPQTADNQDIQRDLEAVNSFVEGGGYVLGWRNQHTQEGKLAIGGGKAKEVLTEEQEKYIQGYFQTLQQASSKNENSVDLPEIKPIGTKKKPDPKPSNKKDDNASKEQVRVAKHVKEMLDNNKYQARVNAIEKNAQAYLAQQKTDKVKELIGICDDYEKQLQTCMSVYNESGQTYQKANSLLAKVSDISERMKNVVENKKVAHFSQDAEIVARDPDTIEKTIQALTPGTINNPNAGSLLIPAGKPIINATDPFNKQVRILVDPVTNGYSVAKQYYSKPDTVRMDLSARSMAGKKVMGKYQQDKENYEFGSGPEIPADEVLVDAMRKVKALLAAAPENSQHSPVKMIGNLPRCYATALMLCLDSLDRSWEPVKFKDIKIDKHQRKFFKNRVFSKKNGILKDNPELKTLFGKAVAPSGLGPDAAPKKPQTSPAKSTPAKGRPRAQSLGGGVDDKKKKEESEPTRPGPGRRGSH